eukprot:TRINITY_DN13286_c0_g1_i1.p1 TRINITY_DN13286_c0_g1~~TRINITY_DN13286_c0_g1_i1.p1  ORF type:complete len:150 (-),score=21.71 TRINITY_DN13286_c0_g1_i1:112-504(-)
MIDDSTRDLLLTGPDEYMLSCECIDSDTGEPHGQIIHTELVCNQPVKFSGVTSSLAPPGPFSPPPTEAPDPDILRLCQPQNIVFGGWSNSMPLVVPVTGVSPADCCMMCLMNRVCVNYSVHNRRRGSVAF